MTSPRQSRVTCLLAITLGATSAVGLTACAGGRTDGRLNVVVVVVDAMRADHLSSQGYALPTTPFLARLGDDAVTFSQAYAQAPWTSSSVASLFTAQVPTTHGVLRIGSEQEGSGRPDGLSPAALTLAEILAGNGYATVLLAANPWLGGGLAQGFEVPQLLRPETPASEVSTMAATLLTALANERRPFLLYLHYMDLHGPYRNPPPPFAELFAEDYRSLPPRPLTPHEKEAYGHIHRRLPADDLREYLLRYDRSLRFVDAALERLWQSLVELGLDGTTLVVITADHGEAFLEHGWPAHGRGVHREQIRVPLLWRQPCCAEPGTRSSVVQLADVLPTLLEVLGVASSASFEPDGTSFAPLLERDVASPERTAWAESHIRGINRIAHRFDGRMWHYDLDRESLVAVYDPVADPEEQDDLLATVAPERRHQVEEEIRRRLAAAEAKGRALGLRDGGPEVTEPARDALRELGYLE